MRTVVALFWIFVLYAIALGYLESPLEARPLSDVYRFGAGDAP